MNPTKVSPGVTRYSMADRDYHHTTPLNDQIVTYLRDRPNTTAGIAIAFSIGYGSARNRLTTMEFDEVLENFDGLWRLV